jgi:hypothetical protein
MRVPNIAIPFQQLNWLMMLVIKFQDFFIGILKSCTQTIRAAVYLIINNPEDGAHDTNRCGRNQQILFS